MDKDLDGIEDSLDLDDDNDGILDADEGGPTTGASGLYQVLGPQLFQYDFSTNNYVPVGEEQDFLYNALGYDPGTDDGGGDDTIYAIARSDGNDSNGVAVANRDLVSVNVATGETTHIGDLSFFDTDGTPISDNGSVAGTFTDGAYFIRSTSSNSLFEVDTATGEGVKLAGSDGFTVSDFAAIDGVFYGVHEDTFYQFDSNAASPTVETITLSDDIPDVSFGSVWVVNGDQLLLQNNDGNIYELTGYDTGAPELVFVASSPGTTQNDGAGDPDLAISFGTDTDGDGVQDHFDLDSDNDGISDIQEGGLDISAFDTDGNGTIDASEIVDTNNDGLDDRVDELDGALDGQVAAPRDTDGDGVADYLDLDSDNDGVSDLQESGISPLLDGNNDGQIDLLGGGAADLDQNGIADVLETATGVPVPQDSDNDGIADYIDLDSDDDGISDYIESQSTADFVAYDGTDTDGDGVIDLVDTTTGRGATFNPTLADTDGDGDADLVDTDADNDGFSDSSESGLIATGTSTNGIDDGSNVTFADQDGQEGNQAGLDGLENGFENGSDADPSDVDFRSIEDADGDGIADNVDLDNDNDGILDVAEGAPTTGASGLYQVLGQQLFQYDVETNDYTAVGDVQSFQYNALGYDTGTDDDGADDILYAIARGDGVDSNGDPVAVSDLVSVSVTTGETTHIGDLSLVDANGAQVGDVGSFAGTFADGSYVIRATSSESLFKVDPATGDGVEIAGSGGFLAADFVSIDGVFYGVNRDTLYTFDSNAESPSVETTTLTDNVPDTFFGSAWVTNGDQLLLQNNDGNIYELTGYDTDNPELVFVANSPPTSSNDGASDPNLVVSFGQDTDGDGVQDFQDLDSDNDGISDIEESGVDVSLYDTDGNGTIDADEIVDTNNDGLDDRIDELDGTLDGEVNAARDTDGDGIADYLDLDSDNDGISDLRESGIDPALDADNDGTIDINANGLAGGEAVDLNKDGIADVVQQDASGAPIPLTVADTDNDGLADYIDLDSDDDGISDFIESRPTDEFVPYDTTDSDGDGIIDLVDNDTGPNPDFGGDFNPTLSDVDGDGTADVLDLDSDGDGILDEDESGLNATGTSTNGIDDGSNVTFADQDGQAGNTQTGVDGLEDGLENGTDADASDVDFRSIDDADGDGIADNVDLDDDNDGILDVAEGAQEGNGSGFYQVLSGQLLDYDFSTNEYIEVGDPAGFGYNALAIDPGTDDGAVDDIIYAVATGTGTDADGDAVARGDIITINPETGEVFGGPSIVLTDSAGSTSGNVNTIAAAFHDDALVIRGPGNALYEVDPLTGAGTEIAGSGGFTPVDFAIIDGVAYGGTNGDLFSFDFNAASPDVVVQALGGPNVPGGGNGAVFTAEGDRLFFSNADSNLYEVTDYDTSSPQIEFVASLPAPTNDGASNGTLAVPTPGDIDGDGILDAHDLDSDNDGISDIEESGVDVSLYDTDGNGTIDADEIVDTNNDGLDDRIDELDGTLDGEVNAARDTDGDGVADHLDLDSDNDGISDLRESGIDPALDADNDGTIDINADGSAGGEAADLNRDGIADVVQQDASGATIPLTVADTDNDGLADYIDLDSDDDGISDFIESRPTDEFVPYDTTDSDDDGIIDLVDNDPAPNFAFGGDFNPTLSDADGDGTADVLDLDSDGDGILDEDESGLSGTGTSTNGIDDGSNVTFADQDGQAGNTQTGVDGLEDYTDNTSDNDASDVDFRSVQDSDNDGIGDHEDLDDDNDGILDAEEIGDTDGDGIDDRLDLDSDNDGISDLEESGVDLDVFDTDRDGQVDGTDFTDTNNDGLDDGVDALDGTPLDGGANAPRDTDGDSVADHVDLDSDNDGISDLRESGTDPALDANNDGTLDLTPGTGEATDTNGDGIADAVQQDAGGKPTPLSDARDSDKDGIADHIDIDADNDGITDFIEGQSTAGYQGTDGDVTDNDADGDGVLDIFETGDADDGVFGGAFEAPEDTDGTGEADYLDLDSDDDGQLDEDESGFDNSGPDNNGDGLSDTAPGSFTDPSGGVDDLLTDLENGTDVDTTETDFRSVPCFVSGTLIATKKGQISVEDLAVGDEVLTVDAGYQPILWIGSRGLSAADLVMHPKLHPVRIKAGALAPNCPEKDLFVSPQHRILIRSKVAQRMFGENEILVPAIKLTGLDGIEVVDAWQGVEYFHILFEHHQIVVSNGAQTESLFTGTEAMKSLSHEAKAEIETLFPELVQPGFEPVSARAIPTKGQQIRNMVERICKNEKLPVEADAE